MLPGLVLLDGQAYDGMPHVGDDPRWDKFGAFHTYLEQAFPKTHAQLSLAKVNTWGLVFEWTGSDSSLKPVLLTGHQGTCLGLLPPLLDSSRR